MCCSFALPFCADFFFKSGLKSKLSKQTIADLKAAVRTAKDKQNAAKEECKKLEKDMDEFKNNKDGKINELKVCFHQPFAENVC